MSAVPFRTEKEDYIRRKFETCERIFQKITVPSDFQQKFFFSTEILAAWHPLLVSGVPSSQHFEAKEYLLYHLKKDLVL